MKGLFSIFVLINILFMNKGRFLHEEKLKDHPTVGVYGIFSTTKVEWRYFVISYRQNSNSSIVLTPEICFSCQEATIESVIKYGKEFENLEQAKDFIKVYKIKWESGSNHTTQEVRAKKINDILQTDK